VLTRVLPHYKAKVMCFVVALNDTQCVVMNGKGVAPADVRGLKERLAKRKEEREAKAKEEEEASKKAEEKPAEAAAEEKPAEAAAED